MPRIVSTTTPYAAPAQAMTLKALQQRQIELEEQASKAAQPQQMISPWQGAAQMANSFVTGLKEKQAQDQYDTGRARLSELLAGGITPDEAPEIYGLDENLGRYAMQRQDQLSDTATQREQVLADAKVKREQELADQQTKGKQATDLKQMEIDAAKQPKLTDISGIRQDVISDPSYKNMAQATPIWSSIKDAAGRDTPQADLNIIIGMAKLFDPTSVVREGETETVKKTADLPDNIFSQYKYLTGQPGSRLDPTVRKDLLTEGASRIKGYSDAYSKTSEFYTNIAKRRGIDPSEIVPGFDVDTNFKVFEPQDREAKIKELEAEIARKKAAAGAQPQVQVPQAQPQQDEGFIVPLTRWLTGG